MSGERRRQTLDDEPPIRSSTTSFVSTVVLSPSPDDSLVSTLNVQLGATDQDQYQDEDTPVSSENWSIVFPEMEAVVQGGLSTLQPLVSTVIQDQHGASSISSPKAGHSQHDCLSVHTKTGFLQGHIYQPITRHIVPFSSRSLTPGRSWSGRVVVCEEDGCCFCSPGLMLGQDTQRSSDPLRPDRWQFDEVEDELEDIWRQTQGQNIQDQICN